MESGDIGFGHKGTSNSKFRSHSASLLAAKATNSAAMVGSVMQVCFLNAQDTAPPPSKYI